MQYIKQHKSIIVGVAVVKNVAVVAAIVIEEAIDAAVV